MGFLRTLFVRLAHFDVLREDHRRNEVKRDEPARTTLSPRVLSSMQTRRPGSPLEGDHRCGTAPGSHRTSLALHHPCNQQGELNLRELLPACQTC